MRRRPLPHVQFVVEYIQAFFMLESDFLPWAQQHQVRSLRPPPMAGADGLAGVHDQADRVRRHARGVGEGHEEESPQRAHFSNREPCQVATVPPLLYC
jgi:hypothetical protein